MKKSFPCGAASLEELLCQKKLLISDYMYILDISAKEIIGYERQSNYTDIICTPLGDGYGVGILRGPKIADIKPIVLPVHVSFLKFGLQINGEEFCNWTNPITLLLDCETLEVAVA